MSTPDPFDKAVELHEAGRLAEAEAVCHQLIAAQPDSPGPLLLLGIIRAQSGDPHGALLLIVRSLGIAPDVPLGHFYHAIVLAQLGRPLDALRSYQRTTELTPEFAEAHYNSGDLLLAMNRPAEALAAFERTIALRADLVQAHCARADALIRLNRQADALTELNGVLARNPHFAPVLNMRGELLCELGRLAESLADCDRSLAIDANQVPAHINRGTTLFAMGRLPEAQQAFDRALALNPNAVKALGMRGVVLAELGRLADSLADFERGVALAPNVAAMHTNLGNTLRLLGRYDRALEAFNRALALDPRFAKAYYGRAAVFHQSEQFELALADCERVLALDPSVSMMASERLHLADLLCDWRDRAARVDDLARRIRQGETVGAWIVITALDDLELQLLAARREAVPAAPAPATKRTTSHERLRIAYLSPDYYDHPVAHHLVELFERHDRTRFGTYGICLRDGPECAIHTRISRAFEHFETVGSRADAEIAELLKSLEIDIAIDLSGSAGHGRPKIFALRPAPVAVNYVGYPGTMGAGHIDYVMADAVTIPPGDERFFAEQVVRLPDCFFPANTVGPRKAPPRRDEAGLPETGFVFCAFNNSYKLTPQMFDIWMRLLRQVDGSVLWLSVGNARARSNLRAEAQARQVSPERLIFAERVAERERHLARLVLADLHLDTLPYNAHSTASDALWMGVPLLTCLGRSFAARVAGSMLTAIGMEELIARDLADYEAMALSLARSPERLSTLREKLAANRSSSTLFDMARLCRRVENAYETMWKRHIEGLRPTGFTVPPL
jgi:predicted O-linked N-acetylglucosamine transferase (SPINDLY family)